MKVSKEKFREILREGAKVVFENIFKDQAKDVQKVMKKLKFTKVKEDDARTWKTACSNIWYKYDADRWDWAYAIKPTMRYVYVYHKEADERATDKMIKKIDKELGRAGLQAMASRSVTGYFEYTEKD